MLITATTQILALELVGPARDAPHHLGLSHAILGELLSSSESWKSARESGEATVVSVAAGFVALFAGSPMTATRCAVELWEMIQDVPLLSVRMVLHEGQAEQTADGGVAGEGTDAANDLLQTAGAGQILLSNEFAAVLPELELSSGMQVASPLGERLKLVILEADDPDDPVADRLEAALSRDGHLTSRDRREVRNVAWATAAEAKIRGADAVVAIVSARSEKSELLQHQLEVAIDERRKRGRPHIIPIWVQDATDASSEGNLQEAVWTGEQDTDRVVAIVRATLAGGQDETEPKALDSAAQVVLGNSKFYVRRSADRELEESLDAHESIVLIKGPRQIGKTSLIGRGIDLVQEKGWRCAATDFEMLSSRQMASDTSFYRVLASTLCRQTGFAYDFEADWDEGFGANLVMDGFLRDMLESSDSPLVWFLDEADRIFTSPFASGFYALVRSWHNARAADPFGPWDRLTVVIGYATEAHLFIKDHNTSPFNVGHRIEVPMFSLEETRDLNARYGHPISWPNEVRALHELVGGQPFLTRRALDVLSSGEMAFGELMSAADQDEGPFGDHLKRILVSVTQLPSVWNALVRTLVSPEPVVESEGVFRLVAAGILVRTARGYELPCELYRRYVSRFANGREAP